MTSHDQREADRPADQNPRHEWADSLEDKRPDGGQEPKGCLRPSILAAVLAGIVVGWLWTGSWHSALSLGVASAVAMYLLTYFFKEELPQTWAKFKEDQKEELAKRLAGSNDDQDEADFGPGRWGLLLIPGLLLMAYGFFTFVSPAAAKYVVPEAWEWPLPAESRLLVLDSGRRAAVTVSGARVQIYDADGQYLHGWFVSGGSTGLSLAGTEGGDTIRVNARKDDTLILYDSDGRVIREEQRPEYFKAGGEGSYETVSRPAPWYKWPLLDPMHGWVLGVIGIALQGACIVLFNHLHRLSREEAQARGGRGLAASLPPSAFAPVDDVWVARRRKAVRLALFGLGGAALLVWLLCTWLDLKLTTVIFVAFCVTIPSLLIGGHIYRAFDNKPGADPASGSRPDGRQGPPYHGGDSSARPATDIQGRPPAPDRGPKPRAAFDQPGAPAWDNFNRARHPNRDYGRAPARSGWPRLLHKRVLLLVLPALLLLYGGLAFVLPSQAHNFLPADWEWPMPAQSRVLLLDSGQRVAVQVNSQRLQVYDPQGKYLSGWYIGGNFDFLGLAGPPADFQDREAVAVQTRDGQKIIYDLEGHILRREDLPDLSPQPKSGRFVDMAFHSSLLTRPLTNSFIAWVLAAIGLLTFGPMVGIVRTLGRRS